MGCWLTFAFGGFPAGQYSYVVDARVHDVHAGAHNGMQKRDKRPDGDWSDCIRFRVQLGWSGFDDLAT